MCFPANRVFPPRRWNWVLDRELYPGWEAMVASLGARGVRVLTYVNSFLQNLTATRNDSRFGPAAKEGVLLVGADRRTPVDVVSGPGLQARLVRKTHGDDRLRPRPRPDRSRCHTSLLYAMRA